METLKIFNSNYSKHIEPEWQEAMNFNGSLCCSIVGIVSNLVIIFIISKIDSIMSRTNKMIMILSINNLLFLINTIVKQYVLRYLQSYETIICITINLEFTFFMACGMTIIILLSKRILKEKRSIDDILLCIFYTIVLVSCVLQTILCVAHVSNEIFDFLTLIIFFFAFGVLIRNEAAIFCKFYNKEASSTPLRINIVRIFMYNMLIALILFNLNHSSPILTILRFTTFLTSLYMVLYLIFSYKNFRICLLNSLRCRSNRINDDPPQQYTDDEDPTVNICCFM